MKRKQQAGMQSECEKEREKKIMRQRTWNKNYESNDTLIVIINIRTQSGYFQLVSVYFKRSQINFCV